MFWGPRRIQIGKVSNVSARAPRKSTGPSGGAHKTAGVPSSPKRSSGLPGRSPRGPRELPRVCRLSHARRRAPSALRGREGERDEVGPAPPRSALGSSTTKLRFELRPPETKSGGPRKMQKKQRNRRFYVLDFVNFLPSAPTRDLGPQAPLI